MTRARALLQMLRGRSAEHHTRRLGRKGERAAARYLRRRGYKILDRNLRSGLGEIDILAASPDRDAIVLVEVKTRAAHHDTHHPPHPARRPERAVNQRKRRKLLSLARSLAKRRGWAEIPIRIDVVAVEFPTHGKPTIRHHTAAVRA